MKKSRNTPGILFPIILLSVGLTAMVIGITKGEVLIVLQKATLICLECIGLG
jgi:hypothetical protein